MPLLRRNEGPIAVRAKPSDSAPDRKQQKASGKQAKMGCYPAQGEDTLIQGVM
jgi:hypothetical protein